MEPAQVYPKIIDVRNLEAALGWSRNTFYFGGGSLLSGIIVAVMKDNPVVYYPGCIIGFLLSVLWLISALRTKELMTFWNGSLGNLEKADMTSGCVRIFGTPEFERLEKKRATNHNVLVTLIGIIGGTWIVLVITRFILQADSDISLWLGLLFNLLRRILS